MTEPYASDMRRQVRIGVRALAEQVLRSGDLESGFAGPARALDGIRAHRKVQRMRPAQYRAEVPVSLRVETERFDLTVSGRMDGVMDGPDRTVVEEIKATARPLDRLAPSPLHWGQARAYAYLYARQAGLAAVTVRLTYVQLDTGEIREFEEDRDRTALEAFFNTLVATYSQWAGVLADWSDLRQASVASLGFPFSRYRPGQREMAVAVYRAVNGRARLFVQAATGIGKTLAAIFPAVKAMGGGAVEKIFYLTARTTGRMAAEKALSILRRAGARLKVLTLTAKDRICFRPDAPCHPDECEFARGFYDRLPRAVADLFDHDAFTRQAVEQAGRDHRICPFALSLEMALWSDLVIGDYNYAFDPRVYLRRFFADGGGAHVFLVDEAHNLVDRSREMFSAQIRKQAFLDTRRAIGDALPGVRRLLGRINSRLVRARKDCTAAGDWHAESAPPEELIALLRRFVFAAEAWLVKNRRAAFREALVDLYFTASAFVRVAERYDDTYTTCYARQGKDLRVKLFCLDPSGPMAEAMNRSASAIFFSATLTPLRYYQTLFGCPADAATLSLPSPFPAENLGLAVMAGVSTLYRDRRRSIDALCRALVCLVRSRPGNYLIFFPSYAYLEMVRAPFAAGCPEAEILAQAPDMDEAAKEAFLARFAPENEGVLVGFVVMGGIFGEGIDLKGDRLSGAAVVGVGLPGITPEQELIREYFDAHRSDGFAYAYRYPGFTRVLQAAGRVIRSGRDRGVVVLIDRRFASAPYTRLYPSTWRLQKAKSPDHLDRILSRFWSAGAGEEGV